MNLYPILTVFFLHLTALSFPPAHFTFLNNMPFWQSLPRFALVVFLGFCPCEALFIVVSLAAACSSVPLPFSYLRLWLTTSRVESMKACLPL